MPIMYPRLIALALVLVQANATLATGSASTCQQSQCAPALLQRTRSTNTIALEADEPATSKPVPTCGIKTVARGHDAGKPCVFPFTYKGVEYTQCTTKDSPRPWCMTADDWDDCDCWFSTSTTTTTTPQSLCSNVAGGVSSTYPCLCGTTAAAKKECMNGQSCTASDDLDGVCLARGQTAPPADYDLVCPECSGNTGKQREFIWQLEPQRGQPWSLMHKKQGDLKQLGPADVRNCNMLASADPFCGLYFLVGNGRCFCYRFGYSSYRNLSGTLRRWSATDFWAGYRRKLPVCSNVANGASSKYPCLCGSTTAAETLCADGEFCTASNDSDGVCQVPVCSNISGGPSSIYPCLCGTSFAATTQCNSTEICTASDDTDGVCGNCQNTCRHRDGELAVSDGFCDDGGPGLDTRECSLGTDCADCGPRTTPTTTPAPGTMLCGNTCEYAGDGVCDDTGPGSSNSKCDFGTDCTDCGARKTGMWTVAYKCAYCKHEGKWDFDTWLTEQQCADYCYSKKFRYMTYTPSGYIVIPGKKYHGTCRCETPELCTKLGNYRPADGVGACQGNVFMYETTQFYTSAGCSTMQPDNGMIPPFDARVPNKLTTLLTDYRAKAAVPCCSQDGKKCWPGNFNAEAKTLQEAAMHCWKNAVHSRLCKLEELKSDMCCGAFDLKRVWTLSKASVCSNRFGGASSTYPCLCGLTDLASTVCQDGQFCTASNDSYGVCQDGPTPPTPSTSSSTPAPSGKCFSSVTIGKKCKDGQYISAIPVEYRSRINGMRNSKPAWDASAGVYRWWDGSTEAACRSSCNTNPECKGYDFWPSGGEIKCALFSNHCPTLQTSRHSDDRHYEVTSCGSEQTTATSTTLRPPTTSTTSTTPAPTSCACGGDMILQAKSYGEEISWEVKDASGTVVCQSGAPGVYKADTTYQIDNCCLATGSQFTLICKDSYNDGWHGSFISMCGKQYCHGFSSGGSHSDTFTTPGPASAPTPAPPATSATSTSARPDITTSITDNIGGRGTGSGGQPRAPASTTPAPTNCACGGDMILQTKEYGEEISWEVKDASGNAVCQSGAPGVYGDDQRYPINCCLSDGIQYTLICKDSYDDGWHGSFISICGQKYCESFSSGGSSTKAIALSGGT